MSLCRSWCYTVNNYTSDEVASLKAIEEGRIEVHVCAEEVGENGTPHLQGYIRFKKPCRLSWWKKTSPRAHVEARKGSEMQAYEYCKKGGNVIIDVGTPLKTQEYATKDAETDAIIKKIEEGQSYPEIRSAHKRFCFWHRRNVFDYMKEESLLKGGEDPFVHYSREQRSL